MEIQAIIDAVTASPELLVGVTNHVIGTEKGTEIITNKANQLYETKIGDELKGIYDRFDQDAFEIIGEKPDVDENGRAVQKTYDFYKVKMQELKDLRAQKSSLTTDAEIKRLTKELETARANGGGAHWEKTFNTAKADWETKEADYKTQLSTLSTSIHTSQVESDINAGRAGIKFNPDIPKSAIDAIYSSVKTQLISSSKKDGDKIVYLDANGAAILNKEFAPASAADILKERMKDVILKDNVPGGGAQDVIVGSIKTTKVEGKDDQQNLVLESSLFKTRIDVMTAASKALQAEGIAKSDPRYQMLLDGAMKEYGKELPRS